MKAFNFAIGIDAAGKPKFLGFADRPSQLAAIEAPKGIVEVHSFSQPHPFRIRRAGAKLAKVEIIKSKKPESVAKPNQPAK